MPRTTFLRLTAASCFLMLGGCQLFANPQMAGNQLGQQPEAAAVAAAPRSATAEGREHLRANRTGLAIAAFQRALASGEDPAAAYNGLGVAYVRLGRYDLGYRFFKKATMSDPGNPVYAGNLTRLMDSPPFTLAAMDRTAAPLAAVAPAPVLAAGPAPRVPGKLYRERDRQFSLVTRPAPVADNVRTAAATPCIPRKGVRANLACARVTLPQTRSRRTASAAAEAATKAKPLPDAANPAAPAAGEARSGKRKVVEFSATPRQPDRNGKAATVARQRSKAAT